MDGKRTTEFTFLGAKTAPSMIEMTARDLPDTTPVVAEALQTEVMQKF